MFQSQYILVTERKHGATFVRIVRIEGMRQILRRLKRSPLFTAITILTLGLGIGANTAVFTVIHAVLIKPLPFEASDQLVGVWQSAPGVGITDLNASPSTHFLYSEENKVFSSIALWRDQSVNVTGGVEPERIPSLVVTESLLPLLGVQPVLGRRFTAQDDAPKAPETVMLSYGYWQRKFGGAPEVLGKRILLDSRAHEVIGVLPAGFRFMNEDPSVVVPFQLNRSEVRLGNFSHQSVARLKPGVTLAQANADMARMLTMLTQKFPPPPGMSAKAFEEARITPNLRFLKDDVIGDIGKVLWVLMGVIGIVLLIACANVANLLLVRVDGRERELSVRAALGATRAHIAGDLLLESLLLGVAGGVTGVGIAFASIRLLHYLTPPYLPRIEEIALSAESLAFSAGLSIVAGLLLGLIPVWKHAGRRLNQALRSGGRTMSEGRERHFARNGLVVVQVGLAMVLLVGAGLMIRSMNALTRVEPGFTQPEQVMTFRLSIPSSLVPEAKNVIRAQQDVMEKLSVIAGVKSVGMSSSITMDGNNSNDPLYVEGVSYREGQLPAIRRYKWVSPNYFSTMGNPLKAGRDLNWTDITDMRAVVMVSEKLATELWGSPGAAIGKRVRESEKGVWREVIGVVGNERDNGVDQPAVASVYWPLAVKQMYGEEVQVSRSMGVAIRSQGAGTATLMNSIRQAVWAVNPNVPIANPRTLQAIYARSLARASFTLTMLSIASGLALLLGVIGIYGVISYTVSQRTREIGIRLALGSPEATVRNMFVVHGLKLALIGVVAGVAAAIPLGKLLSSLLYEVSSADPFTYVAVAVALVASAVLAAFLPARRASRVSPLESLAGD
jgi:predicted permease